MSARPIVLQGGERAPAASKAPESSTLRFDGSVGLWRNADGRLAISASAGPGTTKTATREGIDQSEVSTPSTTITETREGIDQAEVTDTP